VVEVVDEVDCELGEFVEEVQTEPRERASVRIDQLNHSLGPVSARV
jgi:hypothetical protein